MGVYSGTGHNKATERARFAAAVDERRARVASYKVRGFSIRGTIAAMADDGHVNPKTGEPWSVAVINKDLKFLRAQWQAHAAQDFDTHVVNELERIDQVEREAWAAWYRGIGQRKQTATERNLGAADNAQRASGGRVSVRTEDINGDPRYLTIVRECAKDRRELLGLDAPKKLNVQTPATGSGFALKYLTDEELAELERLGEAAAARAAAAVASPEQGA